jgi:hypothetical protein
MEAVQVSHEPKAGPADHEWINRYGTPRLRKILAAGLLEASWNVYAEERFKDEYPDRWCAGWRAEQAELRAIRSPQEEWVDALLLARKEIDGDVALMYTPGKPGQAVLIWRYRGCVMGRRLKGVRPR